MPAIANPPPWFNKVRPTEELVRATSAHDPVLRNRLIALSPTVRPDEAERVVNCAYTTGRELAPSGELSGFPAFRIFSLTSEPEREASAFNGRANS